MNTGLFPTCSSVVGVRYLFATSLTIFPTCVDPVKAHVTLKHLHKPHDNTYLNIGTIGPHSANHFFLYSMAIKNKK